MANFKSNKFFHIYFFVDITDFEKKVNAVIMSVSQTSTCIFPVSWQMSGLRGNIYTNLFVANFKPNIFSFINFLVRRTDFEKKLNTNIMSTLTSALMLQLAISGICWQTNELGGNIYRDLFVANFRISKFPCINFLIEIMNFEKNRKFIIKWRSNSHNNIVLSYNHTIAFL